MYGGYLDKNSPRVFCMQSIARLALEEDALPSVAYKDLQDSRYKTSA